MEASEAWRKALREGAVITVSEGLPAAEMDRTLFDAEMARKSVATIGGYPFYSPMIPEQKKGSLREILADARSVQLFSGTKECGRFHPDYAVSWKSAGGWVELLLCFGCGEMIFRSGESKVKYDMGTDLRGPLSKALDAYRRQRPDPIRDAGDFSGMMMEEGSLSVREGLPHPDTETGLFRKELRRDDIAELSSYDFYTPAVEVAGDAAVALRKAIGRKGALVLWSGEKHGSAAFHPDYAVTVMPEPDGKEVSAFVCLDRREVRLLFPYGECRYDLDKAAADEWAKVLASYATKRPKAR